MRTDGLFSPRENQRTESLDAFATALKFRAMNILSVRLVIASACLLTLQTQSMAFPWPFGKKAPKAAPSAPELQTQESAAAEMLARADAALLAGKTSEAQSLYKQIVRNYPLTSSAATAQFNVAKSYEAKNPQSAYEEYQALVDTYKSSRYFGPAVDAQFEIAKRARTGKLGSLLGLKKIGLKKKLGVEDTVKLFSGVVKNAPQGKHAAEAKFEIGLIHEEDKAHSEAINAFQDVVDQYPKSEYAAQAQKKIADLSFARTDDTRDLNVLKDSRDAATQASTLFPNSTGAEESRDMLPQIDEKVADNAYGIARFYERSKNYKAAIIYYNNVLKFPGGSHFEEAKERVNELTTRDPSLLDQANVKISNKQLAIRAEADVKSRPDYLGPPRPPDLDKASRSAKMRTGTGDAIQFTPLPEEPTLPGDKPSGKPDDTLLLKPGAAPDLELPPVAPLAEPPTPEAPANPAKPVDPPLPTSEEKK